MSFTSEHGFKLRIHAMLQIGLLACVVFSFSTLGLAQAGTLDPTFANHGIFKTNLPNCCGGVSAVALQSDGKILVGGQVTPSRGKLDTSARKIRAKLLSVLGAYPHASAGR